MPEQTPDFGKKQKVDGLYCKKCKKLMTLRDMKITNTEMKCKTCGSIIMVVKD